MFLCFFIWLHDYIWSLIWFVINFLGQVFWPIIQWIIMILWFIPMWILWLWYTIWGIIIPPFDGICVDIFLFIEENILDPILA